MWAYSGGRRFTSPLTEVGVLSAKKDRSKANQIELIYYQYGMAQLLHRKGNNAESLLLTQKTLAIIDSWERTIWLREEVERFHAMLTDAC